MCHKYHCNSFLFRFAKKKKVAFYERISKIHKKIKNKKMFLKSWFKRGVWSLPSKKWRNDWSLWVSPERRQYISPLSLSLSLSLSLVTAGKAKEMMKSGEEEEMEKKKEKRESINNTNNKKKDNSNNDEIALLMEELKRNVLINRNVKSLEKEIPFGYKDLQVACFESLSFGIKNAAYGNLIGQNWVKDWNEKQAKNIEREYLEEQFALYLMHTCLRSPTIEIFVGNENSGKTTLLKSSIIKAQEKCKKLSMAMVYVDLNTNDNTDNSLLHVLISNFPFPEWKRAIDYLNWKAYLRLFTLATHFVFAKDKIRTVFCIDINSTFLKQFGNSKLFFDWLNVLKCLVCYSKACVILILPSPSSALDPSVRSIYDHLTCLPQDFIISSSSDDNNDDRYYQYVAQPYLCHLHNESSSPSVFLPFDIIDLFHFIQKNLHVPNLDYYSPILFALFEFTKGQPYLLDRLVSKLNIQIDNRDQQILHMLQNANKQQWTQFFKKINNSK
ncbi:hypothetical protein RFI_17001 [Reticulomyxa filosa]|uniref:Uncharacterized protein n=1 Tax=Reticulomyxa filosa TaxID=46433 RepID=X6N4G7_RETFI|nr:hypothetical protein RFI_17001 [Reticulomyxa filosa]|eukprot:ETO20217.1 hypothetical protein RFI_17001 [Reticulomyxa filosa]